METFSALLAICAGNSPFSGEFPAQRPVTRSFGDFFDLRSNKRLSKQLWGWWFETHSPPLWRHSNGSRVPQWYYRNIGDRGSPWKHKGLSRLEDNIPRIAFSEWHMSELILLGIPGKLPDLDHRRPCRGTDPRFAPNQWETALLCNDVSHWLGASLESALHVRSGGIPPVVRVQ